MQRRRRRCAGLVPGEDRAVDALGAGFAVRDENVDSGVGAEDDASTKTGDRPSDRRVHLLLVRGNGNADRPCVAAVITGHLASKSTHAGRIVDAAPRAHCSRATGACEKSTSMIRITVTRASGPCG